MAENVNAKTNERMVKEPEYDILGTLSHKFILTPIRLVLKYLVKPILVIALVAGLVRAAFPMNLPEAQGMTYYELLAERFDAYKDGNSTKLIITVIATRFLSLPVEIVYYGSTPSVITIFYPDSRVADWYRTNPGYEWTLPKGEVSVRNIPALYWEAIERTTWEFMVIYMPKYRYPQPIENR